MPIVNIIDRRTRPYRFKVVNAIVEAAWHDNSVADSDQVDPYVGVGCVFRGFSNMKLRGEDCIVRIRSYKSHA